MAVGSKLKRAGWLSLVILFVGTGLGIGVWGFWEATHPPEEEKVSEESSVKCTTDTKITELQTTSTPLAGTKLPNFTPVEKVSQLQCIDGVVGSGPKATSVSTVTANYTGALAKDGVIFESSLDGGQPATFPLSQVIAGWTEGVPGMQPGGTRRLIIPANLAYGSTPPAGSGIPANAALVFDITLISVQ